MQTKTVRWSNNGLATKAPASAPAASAAISQVGAAREAGQQLQHPLQQQPPPPAQPGLAPPQHASAEAFPGVTTTGFSLPDGQAGQERAGSAAGGAQPSRVRLPGEPPDR